MGEGYFVLTAKGPMSIEMIEEFATNAWPAPVQQQLERWRLRAGDNVTRRANSVLAVGAMPVYEGWLDEVTRFYRARDLPVRFHVSDGSPAGLEKMLDGMGYVAEAHTSVQVAPCQVVLERSVPAAGSRQSEMLTFDELDRHWLDSFLEIEGITQTKKEPYARILSGIGPRTHYVQALCEGRPAGVGMAVAERGWAGLFCIATALSHRKQGVGTQIMHELATWSGQNDAKSLYLQVRQDNLPAVGLYSKLGFAHVYGYHYRVLEQKTIGGN
jgi:ribosomal protein S18 acetylase RimI-like enzyme